MPQIWEDLFWLWHLSTYHCVLISVLWVKGQGVYWQIWSLTGVHVLGKNVPAFPQSVKCCNDVKPSETALKDSFKLVLFCYSFAISNRNLSQNRKYPPHLRRNGKLLGILQYSLRKRLLPSDICNGPLFSLLRSLIVQFSYIIFLFCFLYFFALEKC